MNDEQAKDLVSNYITTTGTDPTSIVFDEAGQFGTSGNSGQISTRVPWVGGTGWSAGGASQSFRFDIMEFEEPTIKAQKKRLDHLLREAADCKRILQQLLDEENENRTPRRKLGESLESK
tara:strand:- start:16056 stop:16415 length:360 start_codon:yes stop_codon:yes gene_type:complete